MRASIPAAPRESGKNGRPGLSPGVPTDAAMINLPGAWSFDGRAGSKPSAGDELTDHGSAAGLAALLVWELRPQTSVGPPKSLGDRGTVKSRIGIPANGGQKDGY